MATDAILPSTEADVNMESKPALTPPASDHTDKRDDSGSELSDIEPESEDIGEILPDHYWDNGKIPVFKPTMDQFRSFKNFIHKIDKYGMKSGIVKVIPPSEWRDSLPALDEHVKTVKVKNPITQEFHGTHGTYTQANIEKQRSYNLPQWKALSEESNHQPPARRGQRRRNQEAVPRGTHTQSRQKRDSSTPSVSSQKKKAGRPLKVKPLPTTIKKPEEDSENGVKTDHQVPPTPKSPPPPKPKRIKAEPHSDDEGAPKAKGRQPKSVSSRRLNTRGEKADVVDEEAFKEFDYRTNNQDEWTPERCQELETSYWKGLTFNNPMYGADMPGSLFDDSTEHWNVAKLENLLDVLGQKVPGVNTAYLYLGMWKASFAWHLEDVDLYSINYIHFGAPKQWYSISQADARRFEAAMRNVWPNDAKACDQFLRHKTYLISPQLLQSQYNIHVNRLVHYEGEFVITFPYGYHSGYNLGYNCAESVNFATESWLEYGKVARKCHCEADSVWVDVHDIERKMRGEPTPEYYYEETDEEDDEEDEEEAPTDLPTPPGSVKGKSKPRSHKRKRDINEKDAKPKTKKLRIKLKVPSNEPCTLCPNDSRHERLLPADNGKNAHWRCGMYTPETYIAEENGLEKVCNVGNIDKARLELKCQYCREKRGAVFQCSSKKCTRAYHATCAAQAGVQVDIAPVPVFVGDGTGTEYTDTGFDFRCKFHRSKRGKNVDPMALEDSSFIRKQASKLLGGELVQGQFYQSDIFAGTVLENRKSEQMVVLEVLPKGDIMEVEYKWLLFLEPANSHLPVPSKDAQPLPAHLAHQSRPTAEEPPKDAPKQDQPFCDPTSGFTWSEFQTCKSFRNPAQTKVDLSKTQQLWFYLGKHSTDCRPQYTGDLAIERNDPKANFLESVKPAPIPYTAPAQRRSFPASYPSGVNVKALNAAGISQPKPEPKEREYRGKYAITDPVSKYIKPTVSYGVDSQALQNQRAFQRNASSPQTGTQLYHNHGFQVPKAHMGTPSLSRAGSMTSSGARPEHAHHSVNMPGTLPKPPSVSRPPPLTQIRAPVANMMGGPSQVVPKSAPVVAPEAMKIDKDDAMFRLEDFPIRPYQSSPALLKPDDPLAALLAKYPYLREASKDRPAVYKSPYAPEGGFTSDYLPNPSKSIPILPKTKSLTELWLMSRPLSEQERIKSDAKLKDQGKTGAPQPNHLQHQKHNHYQRHSGNHASFVQPQNLHSPIFDATPSQQAYGYGPQASPTYSSFAHQPATYSHYANYNPTPPQYSPTYSPHNSHSPSYSPNRTQSPNLAYAPGYVQAGLKRRNSSLSHCSYPSTPAAPTGLQFSTQEAFKMQMQQEARSTQGGGFDNFFQDL